MTPVLWLLLLLLMLSATFSGLETAFTSLSIIQIREIRKRSPHKAKIIERMYQEPETVITTLLIGNNLVNTAISVVSADYVLETFGNQNLAIVTGIITIAILIFGEVTPKQLAILGNRFIIEHAALPLLGLVWLFRPVSWLLNSFTRLFKKLTGQTNSKALTAEGLQHMIDHAEDLGILDDASTRMMRGVFRFSGVNIHSIMTHRTQVFSLPQHLSVSQAVESVIHSGFSRIPVYSNDPEVITGIILEKEVLRQQRHGRGSVQLKELMIPPVFVPESWTTEKVFALLRQNRSHMAIVLDEYGGLAGIITINDVIEDILGELPDESAGSDRTRERLAACDEPETWRVAGDLLMYQLLEGTGTEAQVENPNATVAGYVEELTGRIPVPGEIIPSPVGMFVVEESSRTAITLLRLCTRKSEEADPAATP